MSPNEIAVLRIVEEAGAANKRVISRRMNISTDYAAYICDSLTRNGYLLRTPLRGYGLSQKGKEVLLALFYEDKGRMEARIRRLQQLSSEVSQKIDKFGRESVTLK